jgi:hypothetical protein
MTAMISLLSWLIRPPTVRAGKWPDTAGGSASGCAVPGGGRQAGTYQRASGGSAAAAAGQAVRT